MWKIQDELSFLKKKNKEDTSFPARYRFIMLGRQNRKKESKMEVAKRKGKACKNGTKENPLTGVRPSDEISIPPSWLPQFAQDKLCKEETNV